MTPNTQSAMNGNGNPLAAMASTDDIRISTRDIADETGKEHFNVIRDFKNMCEDIGIDAIKFEGIYLDSINRKKKHYLLPKDLAMTLITGYRADLRHKVIKRLEAASGL